MDTPFLRGVRDVALLLLSFWAAVGLLGLAAAWADSTISGPITFSSPSTTVTGATVSVPSATVSVLGLAKLHNAPAAVGWPAALDPNNIVIANIAQASTISTIVGTPEVAVGATATVSVFKAPSGTACSGGTVLHSGSFNANGTAATDQTLTVTTASLAAGDRLCLQTTGGANWTGGVGIGTITVFLAPS